MEKKPIFNRRRRSGIIPNRFKRGFGSTPKPKQPSKPKTV